MSEEQGAWVLTNRDFDVARRLASKHFYEGHEVCAPALSTFARMLVEYRAELLAPLEHFADAGPEVFVDQGIEDAFRALLDKAKGLP